MKSKLIRLLGIAAVAALCGCGKESSSGSTQDKEQTYEVEIRQNALPIVTFKITNLRDCVRICYRDTAYSGVSQGIWVQNPDGTMYIVLDGRITITPVKDDD